MNTLRFEPGDQVRVKAPSFPIEQGTKTISHPTYLDYDYGIDMGYDIIFGYNDDELEPA